MAIEVGGENNLSSVLFFELEVQTGAQEFGCPPLILAEVLPKDDSDKFKISSLVVSSIENQKKLG